MVGTVLDTVIGLSFVFALTALMVTACVEGVAAVTKKRAKWLLRGIQQLFDDPTEVPTDTSKPAQAAKMLAAPVQATRAEMKLYAGAKAPQPEAGNWSHDIVRHPLVEPLRRRTATGRVTDVPQEIPAPLFAQVLLDRLLSATASSATREHVLAALGKPEVPARLRKALTASIRALPEDDTAAVKKAIEEWYAAQMKAVGEYYRRWTKRWAIVIGIAAAFALHVDTIAVAHTLYVDQPVRDATLAAAQSGSLCKAETDPGKLQDCIDDQVDELKEGGLPIGWGNEPEDWPLGLALLGWLLTGLAASFGAPFWFDALKRLSGAKKTLEGT